MYQCDGCLSYLGRGGSWLGCQVWPAISAVSILELVTNSGSSRMSRAPNLHSLRATKLFTIKWKILFMELANPSFNNNFFSNQWLTYISINNAFTNGCNENTLFHEALIHLRYLCLLLISLTDCLVIKSHCLSSLQKRLSQYYIFFYDDEI